jgi:hypothetical protein
MVTIEQARGAKTELQRQLHDVAAVNGIGLSRVGDDWCVRVNVHAGNDLSDLHLPHDIGGVQVCARYVGAARAYTD